MVSDKDTKHKVEFPELDTSSLVELLKWVEGQNLTCFSNLKITTIGDTKR